MFRNKSNTIITRGLFEEESTNPDQVVYCLAREDTKYKSLYKLYMAEADLTEYKFANKYFESFQHWKAICKTAWMHPHIGEWREELELSIRANALSSLISRSETSTEIAKYLLNNNWIDKIHEKNPVVNLRGRPSKEEIRNHLTLVASNQLDEQKDYERIKNL